MEQLGSKGFSLSLIYEYFVKICLENSSLVKIGKAYLNEDRHTFLIMAVSFLLRMRNVSDKSCGGNENTHFVINNFFSKIVLLMR